MTFEKFLRIIKKLSPSLYNKCMMNGEDRFNDNLIDFFISNMPYMTYNSILINENLASNVDIGISATITKIHYCEFIRYNTTKIEWILL